MKKSVRFNEDPKIHILYTWTHAYQIARRGPWEMAARDRERFQHRIREAASHINPILNVTHRNKVYAKINT